MNWIKSMLHQLWASTPFAGSPQASSASLSRSPASPSAAPSQRVPKSGNVERHKIRYQEATANDIITDSEETHYKYDDTVESETTETIVVTPSGVVVKASGIKSYCSVCGLGEAELIRCEVTHMAICNACKQTFEMPDGTEKTVSPKGYQKLEDKYDTWDAFSFRNRKGGQ